MCELFALSAARPVKLNRELKEFFSHGVDNPNGWGLAVFQGSSVSLEKEPRSALESSYLRDRLSVRFDAANMMAHIRKATIGKMEYCNTHPFLRTDSFGHTWTFIHNGTVFQSTPELDRYFHLQEGTTDSERILLYLTDRVDQARRTNPAMTIRDQFHLLDQLLASLSPGNKMNLIFHDGTYLYVHANYRNALYFCRTESSTLISTKPLTSRTGWEEVPLCRLHVLKDGQTIFSGENHGHEYFDNPEDLNQIFLNYSEL